MRRLAPLVALAFGACSLGRDYAESQRVLVDVGMTTEDVVKAVGSPTSRLKVATASTSPDQTTEIWNFEVDGPPGPEDVAMFVLAAGALVLMIASKSGGSVSGGGGTHYRFRVAFGPDGRVRAVTHLEKLK